jgi:hypothetical protein
VASGRARLPVGRAAAGRSIWHSLKIRSPWENENDWAMSSMSTESWFTHRSYLEFESFGVAKTGVSKESRLPRLGRSLALAGPTRQVAPLTLKVACMASPSRFDRREDGCCNSTDLQTFGILQTMLASNFALNVLRAIQIWPK